MKQKEIIQLSVAGLIFVVAGIVVFSQLTPNKDNTSKYKYEDVRPIKAAYSPKLLQAINDPVKVKDFYIPPDLNSGIGNEEPFKPLK